MNVNNGITDISIGLIGPLPPPEGGMANQAKLLSSLLLESGYDVLFVRSNEVYRPGWIRHIRIVRALFRLLFYIASVWSAAGKVHLFHVLANSGWSWYLHSVPVILIGRLRRVPVIINYRGGEADAFFKRSWRWVKPSMQRASVITVPTKFLHEVFKKWGIQTEIVPNIVDLEHFHPGEKNDNQTNKGWHLIVTRNLEKIYGNDIAIEAFYRICQDYPDARLTIAGSGNEKQKLISLVSDLALTNKVTFAGQLDREQIAKLYQSADIMLNASIIDNTPNAIIEALASGVTVVSSDAGGIPFLVNDKEHALLVEMNNPELLAEAVKKVMSDEQLRIKLRNNGLELVTKFSWTHVRKKLFYQYQSVIQGDLL